MYTGHPRLHEICIRQQRFIIKRVSLHVVQLKDDKYMPGRYDPFYRVIRLKAFEVENAFDQVCRSMTRRVRLKLQRGRFPAASWRALPARYQAR